MAATKLWVEGEGIDAGAASRLAGALGLHPLAARALAARGLSDPVLASRFLFQGVAAACEPVLCTMTGWVAAGRCACEHPEAEPGIAPRCCERSAVQAAPTVASPSTTIAQPALPVLGSGGPASCVRPAALQSWPDARALSPPIPILHRALLR
jgi:hypothetical protein